MRTCSAAPLGRADNSEKKTKAEGIKGAKSAARQGKEGERGTIQFISARVYHEHVDL